MRIDASSAKVTDEYQRGDWLRAEIDSDHATRVAGSVPVPGETHGTFLPR